MVEQCGARRRMGEKTCETGGSAGLEELAGLDAGEETCSCPHVGGSVECGVGAQLVLDGGDAVRTKMRPPSDMQPERRSLASNVQGHECPHLRATTPRHAL